MQPELYNKPIVKTLDQMQKGDIFDTFYGDYKNIVRIVFDHAERDPKKPNWVKNVGTYLKNNQAYEGWDYESKNKQIQYEIIGHVNQ